MSVTGSTGTRKIVARDWAGTDLSLLGERTPTKSAGSFRVPDNGAGMNGDVKGSGLGRHLLRGFSRTLASLKFEAPCPERNLEFEHRSTTIH